MGYIEEVRKQVGHMPLILNSSGVFLFNQHKHILLEYRNDTKNWGLPGGYMEPGETFRETAVRELKEEMNVEVDQLTFYDIFSGTDFYHEYPNGDKVYSVVAMFTANLLNCDKIKEDHKEISKTKFFPLDAFPSDMTETTGRILKHYSDTYER